MPKRMINPRLLELETAKQILEEVLPRPALGCRVHDPAKARGEELERGELAIRRKVSRLHYFPRCAEASTVQAYMKQGLSLAPGIEIDYVVKDAKKWEVDPERTASEFDADCYRGLLEMAWGEAAFVFTHEPEKNEDPLGYSAEDDAPEYVSKMLPEISEISCI